MAVQRDHPYMNYNFLVSFGTPPEEVGFAEVVGLEFSIDAVEYREGGDPESGVRKLPGRAKYSDVVLKRGLMGALNLYEWISEVRNGNVNAARTVRIQLQNEDRTEIVWTWKLLRAWPAAYRFSSLDAKGKDVVIEMLQLTFERLEIE